MLADECVVCIIKMEAEKVRDFTETLLLNNATVVVVKLCLKVKHEVLWSLHSPHNLSPILRSIFRSLPLALFFLSHHFNLLFHCSCHSWLLYFLPDCILQYAKVAFSQSFNNSSSDCLSRGQTAVCNDRTTRLKASPALIPLLGLLLRLTNWFENVIKCVLFFCHFAWMIRDHSQIKYTARYCFFDQFKLKIAAEHSLFYLCQAV